MSESHQNMKNGDFKASFNINIHTWINIHKKWVTFIININLCDSKFANMETTHIF